MRFLSIFLIFLFGCQNESFRFGLAVRFAEKDANHFCNGRLRNPLPFGYYQVDDVFCHYKTPGEHPIVSSAGWDQKSAMIVSKSDMRYLYSMNEDEATGYRSWVPVESNYREKSYYLDDQGNYRLNLTGEIIPKSVPNKQKLDAVLYDKESCKGYVDGYLWAKTALPKVAKPEKVTLIKDCLRVYPEMKKRKLSSRADKILTALFGGKENYRREMESH